MPNEPPGESSLEISVVTQKPKGKRKWLPLELQHMIIHLLDTPSYVEEHLEDDPAEFFDLEGRPRGSEARKDLKNASLVCRAWRREARPLLFRYVHLRFCTPVDPAIKEETRVYSDAIAFLREREEWFKHVLRSITISLLVPKAVEELMCKVESLAEDYACDPDSLKDAFGSDDENLSDVEMLEGLYDVLRPIRPQRITTMATGAPMEVFVRDLSRYPNGHPFIHDPRLQILSISRRNKDANTAPEWQYNPFANIIHLVQGEVVIVNEGSLLRHSRGRVFGGMRESEPNLHQALLQGTGIGDFQGTHLKSLTFISLFNFDRGLLPLAHDQSSARGVPHFDRTIMAKPKMYSHRILPHDFDLKDFLIKDSPPRNWMTSIENTEARERSQKNFDEVMDLSKYNVVLNEVDWAGAYHFCDLEIAIDATRRRSLFRSFNEVENLTLRTRLNGWLVRESCFTDPAWTESDDQDKREVIEMMDGEEWFREQQEMNEEADRQHEAAMNEYAEMREEELMNEQWDDEYESLHQPPRTW
jgi:hypothetical protein